MAELSKQRRKAGNQFLNTQTKALSQARILSETERLAQQRADNMTKLRGLRLAKAATDMQAALGAQASMKTRRRSGFK